MIMRPQGISRRGFLRNILGVTAAVIMPVKPIGQVWRETAERLILANGQLRVTNDRIRGISHNVTIWDELDEEGIDMSLYDSIKKDFLDRAGVPRGLVFAPLNSTPKRLDPRYAMQF